MRSILDMTASARKYRAKGGKQINLSLVMQTYNKEHEQRSGLCYVNTFYILKHSTFFLIMLHDGIQTS